MKKIFYKPKFNFLLMQFLASIFAFFLCTPFSQAASIEKDELHKIIVGKTFWFYPNSNVFSRCRKVDFYENGRKLLFDYSNQLQFKFEVVDADIKVKINEQINATTKIEFLEKNMFIYENDEQYLDTCFSDKSPSEHTLKLLQIQKAEEERIAKNRKGGVRIGMTAKHVREKTDWGEPQTINATITPSGRREQWVYGDGDYLYFKNGILDSIQVRK